MYLNDLVMECVLYQVAGATGVGVVARTSADILEP